jgi:HEAT repeat protein
MPEYTFDDMARYVKGRGRFDVDVRVDAIELLADVRDERVLPLLDQVADDPDEIDDVREAADQARQRLRA